jgi:hypothetical protein
MHNTLALDTNYPLLPAVKICLVADKKRNEHGRIHLADLDAAETARVAGGDVLGGVGGRVFVVGKQGARCVRVEVEEVVTLVANEVVRRGRAPAEEYQYQRQSRWLEVTYPAMPMDCRICSADFNASQYTGVILSMPSRVPTRMRVG